MINLNFASNLNVLADQAIDQLKSAWTDPFTAPAIVFPDKKIEQWFRLRWVSKYGAIGNLNAKTIDAFLWESLQPDENQKLLTDDILQSVILAYFLENTKTLPEQCLTYLQKAGVAPIAEVGVAGIDEAKAFDLSQKLSSLFRDYELTRPEILDYWKDGDVKEFFGPKEKWQRDIYSAVFHKGAEGTSFFQKVFDAYNAKNETQLQYMTLPYWFNVKKTCLKEYAGRKFFIFGLSNVGQFYHKMLKEMSDAGSEIVAFIQNPCSEYWEDVDCRSSKYNVELDEFGNCPENENPLLMRFGKSGRENVRTWNQLVDYDLDPIPKKETYDSVLHAAQSLVLNRKCSLEDEGVAMPRMDRDDSFTITAAPNYIREVENLHTQICKILENGGNIKDILVLAPNLDDYHSAIVQVFESAGYKKGVPYKILDSKEGTSFTADALSVLLDVRESGNFNREQLFLLLENPVVQASRNITQYDVENYQAIVNELPAYRCKATEDAFTWKRTVKRLLLSKWMNKPFGDIIPYASMESSDESSLVKFIAVLDDLEKFAQSSENDKIKDENQLESLKDDLIVWLRGSEEKSAMSSIYLAFHSLKLMVASGVEELPFKIAYYCLKQTVGNAKVSSDKLFIDGVSFMKLMPNRVVPAKHLFLMGMGAEQYPGVNEDNSLDLRIAAGRILGDDNIVDKNKYVFLCQLMSAEESFHISYVNQNLKKASKLDTSSVVRELFDFINLSILKSPYEFNKFYTELTLSEKRPYEDLYTRRSYRNYCVSKRESKGSQQVYSIVQRSKSDEEKKIVITDRQLKKFLENPFEFQVSNSLNIRDEDESVVKDQFEPIDAEYLKKYKIDHDYIERYLRYDEKNFDFSLSENAGDLPAAPFNDAVKKNLQEIFEVQVKAVDDMDGKQLLNKIPLKKEYALSANVVLQTEIKQYFRDGTAITLFDPSIENMKDKNGKGVEKLKKHILQYVQGLILLATGECESVTSVVFFSDGTQKVHINLSQSAAKDRLNAIYEAAFVEKFRMLLPINFVWKVLKEEDSVKRENFLMKSFTEFTDGDHAEYKSGYFPLFKIFDYKDCGFSNKWLTNDLKVGVEKMGALIGGIQFE